MKTKTIFKMLATAMLMPTMLLTTACSNNDDEIINTENPANIQKGYTLPVTVNVTRQGDESTTRASYNESTRKLSFSAGDKLFVMDDHDKAGQFAGTLDYDAVSGKFSGTVTTKNSYSGTADELFTDANPVNAFLLPTGYESYGFFSIVGSGYDATLTNDFTKAFALTKAAAVEQFSFERAFSYSSGFALAPFYAIASFTISGLTANKKVEVSFDTNSVGVISGNVTTSAEGVATFVVGVFPGKDLKDCTLTVDGNNIAMPTKTTEAGHIYNISRSVAPAPTARALAEATTDDIGKIAGADGNIYDSKDAAEAAGTTAVAMIAYVGSETEHTTYNHGLAIALADEGKMNWSTAKSTCEGKSTVTGAAWLLPSQNQWMAMFKPIWNTEYGYYANSYSDLNTNITTAGGTALQENVNYWTSSEDASKQEAEDVLNNGVLNAYYVFTWDDDAIIDNSDFKTNDWYFVRAVLVF